jgi:hypothetical protein
MSESSWSSDEEWPTIAAMVRDTQDNGSNAVEGDTEDDSSVTNRQAKYRITSHILLPNK